MLPSRHRGYPRLADSQGATRCVTAPSRVVPLPLSKEGRLPSRKPVAVWLTAIVASNDSDSATPRPPSGYQIPFSPSSTIRLCLCCPLVAVPQPLNPAIRACHPDHRRPRCDGGPATPKLHLGPFFVLLATLESGFAARPSRWIWLGWVKQASLFENARGSSSCKISLPTPRTKRGRLVSFGPVNKGGAPASRGGQQESSHRVPRLPRSFGTASSMYVPAVSCVCANRVPVRCSPVEPHAGMESTRTCRGPEQLSRKTVASATVQFKRPAQRFPKAHRPARHQAGAARRHMLVLRAGKGDMSWREAIGIDSISTETTA